MLTSFDLATVAQQLAVSVRTVEEWIANGELSAVNVSRNRKSRKPRLRVLQRDLDQFLASRSTNMTPERQPRSTRQRIEVEQFV